MRFYQIYQQGDSLSNNFEALSIFEDNSNVFKTKRSRNKERYLSEIKSNIKSIRFFNHLTITHLIMFCCQQFSSHTEKLSKDILQKITNFYSKMIPDYKVKEGLNTKLLTSTRFDFEGEGVEPEVKEIFVKNISRNVSNKSLLNSFLNILDEGLDTDYYKEFLPMAKGIEHKLKEGSNVNIVEREKFVNLRKYLQPKIEKRELPKKEGEEQLLFFINLYRDQYIKIEDQYMKHLSNSIKYDNYHIDEETKERVNIFNKFVLMKKKIIQSGIKLRLIVEEGTLNEVIRILIKNREYLKKLKEGKEEKEKKKNEEKKKDSRNPSDQDRDDDNSSDKEHKKDNKQEEKPYTQYNYMKIRNLKECEEIKREWEENAIPDSDIFLQSIYFYIKPTKNKEKLSFYLSRRDFIYQELMKQQKDSSSSHLEEEKTENNESANPLALYLSEAKNSFELNVFQIEYKESGSDNKFFHYFHSYVIIEGNLKKISKTKPELILIDIKMGDCKIVMLNIIPNNENKVGYNKYITNENSGVLYVYFINPRAEGYKYDNNVTEKEIFEKIINFQATTENINVEEIEIEGNLKVSCIDDMLIKKEQKEQRGELKRYVISIKKVDYKPKIMSFANI